MTAHPELDVAPRTRRTVLAAAVGGIGAFVASALGRPLPARAAAGDPFVIGAVNDAATSQSILLSAAGGATFTLKDSAAGGTGVFGWSSATTGTGRGLYGRADSPQGNAIEANHTAATGGSGAAIRATSIENVAVYANGGALGVRAHSGGGTGLHASSLLGHAIEADTADDDAVVVTVDQGYKAVKATALLGTGVYGETNSGTAVRAEATSGTGVSAYATSGDALIATSLSGDAIIANASGGFGLNAHTTSGIAVYGYSTLNWSLYGGIDARVENDFQVGGNASVAGSLSKGGGSFRIDHPLDPGGKYLQHSFVESPDMLNVYNGVATLDARGEATVRMASWFDALNRDVRYQLTALGKPAPELHVKTELADGRFTIGGGAPGQRVSWLLTGIRQDAWANANRIEVELRKTGRESGTYLHPELFGQPRSKRTPALHPVPASPIDA